MISSHRKCVKWSCLVVLAVVLFALIGHLVAERRERRKSAEQFVSRMESMIDCLKAGDVDGYNKLRLDALKSADSDAELIESLRGKELERCETTAVRLHLLSRDLMAEDLTRTIE